MAIDTRNYDPAQSQGASVNVQSLVSIYAGSGTPNAVITANKGSLYLNTAGTGVADRAYINTNGGTTWTAITTVA